MGAEGATHAPGSTPSSGAPDRGLNPAARASPVHDGAAAPRAVLPHRGTLAALQRAAGNRAVAALLAQRSVPAASVETPAAASTTAAAAPTAAAAGPAAPSPREASCAAVQRHYVNARTFSPVEPVTGQGTAVVGIVGPGHVYGSKTGQAHGFAPFDHMRLFAGATGVAYVQGHLFNDHLGGPGHRAAPHAAENLTAFPKVPTNVDHSNGIEEWVKAAAQGAWFRYSVTIGYSTDSGPRLRHRLGPARQGLAAAVGLAPAAATFTYASSLHASWDELVNAPAHTNAAPVVDPLGTNGTLSLAIPSPMTVTKPATRALELPLAGGSWQHHPTFKGPHTGVWTGVLPPGGALNPPPNPARTFMLAERWRGSDDAQAGNPAAVAGNAVYQLGHQHYGDGVAGSRAGPVSTTRFGRGYLLGYQDFDAGIQHGKANPLATPPAGPAATVAGHTELWAGVATGATQLLAAPPVGNRAEIAGHAEYWAGVQHARGNAKASPPAGSAAQTAGHDDYWAGVTHAQTSAKGAPPVGNHAQKEAHDAYWDAVEKVGADLAAPAPAVHAGLAGHTEVLDTVTLARGHPRTTALPTPTLARTAAWTGYWVGVDAARASSPPVAYTGKDATAAAGFADHRAGAVAAAQDLASLRGPAPAGGGGAEGFGDYRQGVEDALTGKPADAARPAHARGWADCTQGMAEGDTATAPSRTDGGFAAGHLYGQGTATARVGGPAPTGTTTEATLTSAGHSDHRTGVGTARTDRTAPKPTTRGGALGFDEFVAGITTAQAGDPAAPAPTGSEATAAGWTEYWRGVDQARTAPWAAPFAGTGSAEAAGHEDYRAGVARAGATLAALTGSAPTGGGTTLGFADYREGVEDHKAGAGADAKRAGHARGWQDCGAGMAEAEHGAAPSRTEGGFASGYLYGHGAATARAGTPAPAGPGIEDALTGAGFTDYRDGTDAARTSLTASRPTRAAAARGFDEYLAGVATARTVVRTGTAPTGTAAAAGWAEYWRGVDTARTSGWGAPYSGTSSAEAAGHADHRAGAELARTDLPSMTGAAPAGGGRSEGFDDYRQGVRDAVGGQPADPARSAHARGWADCTAGVAEGESGTVPTRTQSGFTSGHLYGQGAATARTGGGAPAAAVSPQDQLTAAGHGHYRDGLAAARADRTTAPTAPGARLGFEEFVSGITQARTGVRTVPPGAGSQARTAGWTEYWQGVDLGRSIAWGAPSAAAGSAQAEGVVDYRAGATTAQGSLAGLTGPAPVGGGAPLGFDDYRAGVEDRKAAAPADPTRSGHARGWQDCADGMAAGRSAPDTPSLQTGGGYLSGHLHAQGAARAHAGRPDVLPTTAAETIRSTGHAGYAAGVDAARRDLGTPPTRVVERAAFDEYVQALAAARTAARGHLVAGAAGAAAVTEYWRGVDAARAQPHTVAVATPTTADAGGAADYRAGVAHAVGNAAGTPPPATTAGAEGATDYWAGEAHALGSLVAPGGPAAASTAAHDLDGGRVHARASIAQLQGAAPLGRAAARGFTEYSTGVATRAAGAGDQPARAIFSQGWQDYAAGEADKRRGLALPAQQHSGYLLAFQNTAAAAVKRDADPLHPLDRPEKRVHV